MFMHKKNPWLWSGKDAIFFLNTQFLSPQPPLEKPKYLAKTPHFDATVAAGSDVASH